MRQLFQISAIAACLEKHSTCREVCSDKVMKLLQLLDAIDLRAATYGQRARVVEYSQKKKGETTHAI